MKIQKPLRLISALALYILAALFCGKTASDAQMTYLILKEGIDASSERSIFLGEAALPEPVSFCFWGEGPEKTVLCPVTGGTAEVSTVYLAGDPALLDAGILTLQEGCLVDSETAQALFGTKECARQQLILDGSPCPVLNTLPSSVPTLMTRAGESNGNVLDRCILAAPAGAEGAEQFLMRWGLTGEAADYQSLWIGCFDLLLLPPGLILLSFLRRGRKKWRAQPLKKLLLTLAAAGALLLLCRQILVPEGFLPARWSDFSHWSRWLEGQRQNLQLVLSPSTGHRQLQMLLDMVKSMLCTAGTILLLYRSDS